MIFRIAGCCHAEIGRLFQISDQVRRMRKYILRRDVRVSIAPQRKDIFNPVVGDLLCKGIDLLPVITQTGQVNDRLNVIFLTDHLRDRDRLIVVGTPSRTERNTDVVWLKLREDFQRRLDVHELRIFFRREYFKRQHLLLAVIDLCQLHFRFLLLFNIRFFSSLPEFSTSFTFMHSE